jgi:hypothetical protein
MGKSIYKFSPPNKYFFDNLSNCQFYCNHYTSFNDPFECWCIEKTGIPDPVKEKDRYNSIASAWGYDPEDRNEFIEYCSEFDHDYSMRVAHCVESARISCFCKRKDNLLMWAHYADGLRGFCLEFDKTKILKNNLYDAEIFDVKYQVVPPVVDTMLYEVANDQIWYHEMVIEEEESKKKYIGNYVPDKLLPEYQIALLEAKKRLLDLYFKMLCYKPINWKYEEEVRLVYHTKSKDKHGESYKYKASAIKSIIIGERASEDNINLLFEILKKKELNIPMYKVYRNQNNYNLIIKSFEF